MAEEPMCHCGKPLHYTSQEHRAVADQLIKEYGEYVTVTVLGRTWLVPRHYIALHGLKAEEIHKLGFEEVHG